MSEKIDIVDENDQILGTVDREDTFNSAVITRGVLVFVFNREGKLFMHQRKKSKKVYPGLWGIGAGGGVMSDETYEHASERELIEETGVRNVRIDFMFHFRYRSGYHNVNFQVFKCEYNGRIQVNMTHDEFERGEFKTIEEVKEMAASGLLCPDTALIFEKWLELNGISSVHPSEILEDQG